MGPWTSYWTGHSVDDGDAGKTVRRVWIPEPDDVPLAEPSPETAPAAEPEPVPA